MKFDVCIMNPPYDNRLHEKFLAKMIDISLNGVSIQPSIFINKQNVGRKKYKELVSKIQNRISDIEIIDHRKANDLFNLGNTIQELGIFYWNENTTFDINSFCYNSEIEKSLFNKTRVENNDFLCLIRGKGKFSCRYINPKEEQPKENEVPVYSWHGGNTCKDAVLVPEHLWNKKAKLLCVFKTKEEAENYKKCLDTKFANWYYWNYVVPGDCKILVYMFRPIDCSKEWTDERFYKELNLTKEEIDIIENFKHN